MKRITLYFDDDKDEEVREKLRYVSYRDAKSMSRIIIEMLKEKLKDVKYPEPNGDWKGL